MQPLLPDINSVLPEQEHEMLYDEEQQVLFRLLQSEYSVRSHCQVQYGDLQLLRSLLRHMQHVQDLR